MKAPDYTIQEAVKGFIFKNCVYDVYVKCYKEERSRDNKQIFVIDYNLYKSGFKTEQDARDFISKQEPVKEPVFNEHISEPVISFLKCFKQTPRRFKTERSYPKEDRGTYTRVRLELLDLVSQEKYEIDAYQFHRSTKYRANTKNLLWATEDELAYLVEEVGKIVKERVERLKYLKDVRAKRNNQKERTRLTEIYKMGIDDV